jgi:hypothetical protein
MTTKKQKCIVERNTTDESIRTTVRKQDIMIIRTTTKKAVDVGIIEVKTKNIDMMTTETKNLVDIETNTKIMTPDIGITE